MWLSFADYKKKRINIPIDQSKFDHHARKETLFNLNTAIIELLKHNLGEEHDAVGVMRKIRKQLTKGIVRYRMPDNTLREAEYHSGVLSGWTFTAFYDTMINVAESMVAQKLIKEQYSYIITPTLENFQGDDQLMQYNTWNEAILHYAAMKSFGLEIHLQKSFFSVKHNEYLRKYSTAEYINGYPARMLNALCWLYPGDTIQKDKSQYASALYDNWEKMAQRLRISTTHVSKFMEEDMKGAKIPKAIYSAIIHAPRVFGGKGVKPWKAQMVNKIGGSWLYRPQVVGKGLEQFRAEFGNHQPRELENWFLETIDVKATYLKLPMIETIKKISIPNERPFIFSKVSQPAKNATRIKGWPNSVIFGQSDKLMKEIFPDIDMYLKQKRLPKTWIYDYLTGKLDIVTPKIEGMSIEYSSLIWHEWRNSMIAAMYNKRGSTKERWVELSLYAESNFSNFIHNKRRWPEMYG
jgi:hypothetical protein